MRIFCFVYIFFFLFFGGFIAFFFRACCVEKGLLRCVNMLVMGEFPTFVLFVWRDLIYLRVLPQLKAFRLNVFFFPFAASFFIFILFYLFIYFFFKFILE